MIYRYTQQELNDSVVQELLKTNSRNSLEKLYRTYSKRTGVGLKNDPKNADSIEELACAVYDLAKINSFFNEFISLSFFSIASLNCSSLLFKASEY